jgi:hypothetical protein
VRVPVPRPGDHLPDPALSARWGLLAVWRQFAMTIFYDVLKD